MTVNDSLLKNGVCYITSMKNAQRDKIHVSKTIKEFISKNNVYGNLVSLHKIKLILTRTCLWVGRKNFSSMAEINTQSESPWSTIDESLVTVTSG